MICSFFVAAFVAVDFRFLFKNAEQIEVEVSELSTISST
jgi:hypothetical protein